MGVPNNGGGNAGDVGQQSNQPQGTEYTLQGRIGHKVRGAQDRPLTHNRSYALSSDRMAST